MIRKGRKGCEFSTRIKEEEVARWHKNNPGEHDNLVQVHHILPISEALLRNVPKRLIRSQENAVAVAIGFHSHIHFNTTKETYDILASELINSIQS